MTCGVYGSATYSYAYCYAADAAGHSFYCSSTSPGILSAVRGLKEYSRVWFYRHPSSNECVEIRVNNSTDYLPDDNESR